ncbi:hypothetical protein AKJ16_DCAP06272 [Drosera capensis]
MRICSRNGRFNEQKIQPKATIGENKDRCVEDEINNRGFDASRMQQQLMMVFHDALRIYRIALCYWF